MPCNVRRMRPELRALAVGQGGLVTRQQALRAGYRERELKTLTGSRGAWVVVRRGVYAERAVWTTLTEDDRYRARIRAVSLAATRPAVISHSSAAAIHGLPLRPYWRELVHLTRTGVLGSRTEGGVKHHGARHDHGEVDRVGGLLVTGLARTAIDVAREFGFEDGVVACDAALQRGVRREDLELAVAVMAYWPYVAQARAAVAAADAGAQSIGETLTRLVVVSLGLGTPETQFELRDGNRVAYADLRIRRHLIEFDGRVKYVGRDRGGVADRPAEQILWDEKRREDWMRSHDGGYGLSRVVWDDLTAVRRPQTARRLAEDIQRSDRLFGHLDG